MLDTIFREYDIRGLVGTEFVLENTYDLARSIAYYFTLKNPEVTTVVVGMDGRTHSPAIAQQVHEALRDSGLDVVSIGICTSPMLYFALHTLDVQAGLMITASHNPAEYNGLKICLGTTSVWGVQVRDIKALFKQRVVRVSEHKGTLRTTSIREAYLAYMVDQFSHLRGMDFPLVIDCGNGAGGVIIPHLVQALGWSRVTLLYVEVDGSYPNHEADPVKEKNMLDVKQALATTEAQLGIGLDGDADRMAAMTKSGYLIPGDLMLALFARAVLEQHPGAGVVMDIKSSATLLNLLALWKARAHMSPSGHAIVKDMMRQHDALLGGELSCHFFFKDRYFGYDDGVYAMLRLLEIVTSLPGTLDEYLCQFPTKINSPEIHLPCADDDKKIIIEHVATMLGKRSDIAMITIDGVRASTPYGWGLVRASNTQPMLSIRFEADSVDGIKRIKQDFVAVLQPYFLSNVLCTAFGLEQENGG